MTIQQLQRMQHELAEAVREYSRSQVELWRQLPWFVLQSQGRTGWGPGHEYSVGVRILPSLDAHGYHIGCVDLETGELIYTPKNQSDIRPIRDAQVLQIKLEELDAKTVLALYKKLAKEETGSYYDAQEQRQKRRELAKRYGLSEGKPYKRTKSFQVVESYMG